jgi:tRNA (cytidine32/uridine32-2'-O)-methyltransferase
MQLSQANIYFVLVRPVFLGNIGATARLMKNFGFEKLRLVDAPRNYKDAEARKMAVDAFDILKAAEVFSSLPEAVADLNLVVGTSSGQQRSQPLESLPQFLERAAAQNLESTNKIAIVLGDERNGLSIDELAICNVQIRIPTNPLFPSLNVSQAACILAYEISKFCTTTDSVSSGDAVNASTDLLTTPDDERELFEQLSQVLEKIQFSRAHNKDLVLAQLRQFYKRALPTKRESDLLRGVLHRLKSLPEHDT